MKSIFRNIRHHLVLALAIFAIPLTGSVAAIHAHAWLTPNSQWSTTAQNDRLAAINTAAATGFVDIYTGSQPANANSSVTGTLLCSIPLGSTAFHAPSSGTMTNNGALSCTAGASGTAGYIVMYASNHTTILFMGNAGTSASNLNLATTTITSGITVNVADAAITITDLGSVTGY